MVIFKFKFKQDLTQVYTTECTDQ